MLRALVSSVERFKDELAPLGYEKADIRWVIDIDPDTGVANLLPFKKGDLQRVVPIRGDRSGKASEENSKPALLTDRASYALGVSSPDSESSTELVHASFKRMLGEYARVEPEASSIRQFLDAKPISRDPGTLNAPRDLCRWEDDGGAGTGTRDGEQNALIWKTVSEKVTPSDMVAFRSNAGGQYPFESPKAQRFWEDVLERSYEAGSATCAICGQYRKELRILPWQVSIAGQSCPISSFNGTAFESFGREQLANSPICFECGGRARRLLQRRIQDARHSCFLAREDSKGKGRSPLKNQVAVFWLKETSRISDPSAPSIKIDLDEVLSAPLRHVSGDAPPPAEVAQMERLLSMPWKTASESLRISRNSFFLGVLSPNKSRLVIREWLAESIDSVWGNLGAYERALRIIDLDGERIWAPSIGAIFSALKPEGVTSATPAGDLLRGLLRTAYKGFCPPAALLSVAVRRFRIPDKKLRKATKEMQRIQALRRMALAGVLKLVLNSGNGKAEIMEELNDQNASPPYLCGRLLAILEQAQLRAAHWRITATLVDRCYGTASTSPNSIFGPLINLATKAHFPKLRKEYGGVAYRELEPMLEDVMSAIKIGGGFASVLNLREQAEFGLGFYQQRSCFRKLRIAAQKRAEELQSRANSVEGANNEPHGSR